MENAELLEAIRAIIKEEVRIAVKEEIKPIIELVESLDAKIESIRIELRTEIRSGLKRLDQRLTDEINRSNLRLSDRMTKIEKRLDYLEDEKQ